MVRRKWRNKHRQDNSPSRTLECFPQVFVALISGRYFVGRCFVLARGKTTNNNTITKPVEREKRRRRRKKASLKSLFHLMLSLTERAVEKTGGGKEEKKKLEN
ncbi:unnamed protein product [Meloidogyne enterolobii]|uniref:Uncharacterized protein n=1 Tax=Meloidogyne enterolobii TaxID=390850 RepID=A0ACB0XXI2_MELEN